MKAHIKRSYFEDKQTLGSLQLFDEDNRVVFECKTLELPWKNNQRQVSCIPTGTYKVVIRYSKKFGWHFHVTDVEGRTWILIHHGNYHRDILGCILVGKSHKDIDQDGYRDVTSSKPTLKKMRELAPEGFELIIE